ncbi:MAG: hypothetical protein COZ47_02650, partial [Lysobacterales bacterium CG_4_10_14_3_um_filter_64_11]
MDCPDCKTANAEHARFCRNCGHDLSGIAVKPASPDVVSQCANCATPLRPGAAFCGRCGTSTRPAADNAQVFSPSAPDTRAAAAAKVPATAPGN